MTNNFDAIRNYISELGIPQKYDIKCDLYFNIDLIRRGKDHPGLPAANYIFKQYYVDCLDNYDKFKNEIIQCCELLGLRAYVSVNVKSKHEAALRTIQKYAINLTSGEFRKPWRVFASVCGEQKGKDKRWVIDCDDCEDLNTLVETTKHIICECRSKYADPIVTTIPTRSGYHIITKPFDQKIYKAKFNEIGVKFPEIKENHLTLLYENI